jgi:hypothetical protein
MAVPGAAKRRVILLKSPRYSACGANFFVPVAQRLQGSRLRHDFFRPARGIAERGTNIPNKNRQLEGTDLPLTLPGEPCIYIESIFRNCLPPEYGGCCMFWFANPVPDMTRDAPQRDSALGSAIPPVLPAPRVRGSRPFRGGFGRISGFRLQTRRNTAP